MIVTTQFSIDKINISDVTDGEFLRQQIDRLRPDRALDADASNIFVTLSGARRADTPHRPVLGSVVHGRLVRTAQTG